MKRRLLSAAFAVLAVSLAGCATGGGGYGSGGGAYFADCGYDEDCYGGPQYTCVFYETPAAPSVRMDIFLAQRHHGTRIVGPRDPGPGMSSFDSSGSSVPSGSSAAPSITVAREPVVVASPSVDRGSPRVRN